MSLFRLDRLLRFGGLTALSFALNLGISTALTEWAGWAPGNAYSVALSVVLAVNFTAMRFVVFRASGQGALGQLAGFLVSSLVFRAAERLLFEWISVRGGVQYQLAIIGISVGSAAVKYVFYGLTFFRPASGGPGRK